MFPEFISSSINTNYYLKRAGEAEFNQRMAWALGALVLLGTAIAGVGVGAHYAMQGQLPGILHYLQPLQKVGMLGSLVMMSGGSALTAGSCIAISLLGSHMPGSDLKNVRSYRDQLCQYFDEKLPEQTYTFFVQENGKITWITKGWQAKGGIQKGDREGGIEIAVEIFDDLSKEGMDKLIQLYPGREFTQCVLAKKQYTKIDNSRYLVRHADQTYECIHVNCFDKNKVENYECVELFAAPKIDIKGRLQKFFERNLRNGTFTYYPQPGGDYAVASKDASGKLTIVFDVNYNNLEAELEKLYDKQVYRQSFLEKNQWAIVGDRALIRDEHGAHRMSECEGRVFYLTPSSRKLEQVQLFTQDRMVPKFRSDSKGDPRQADLTASLRSEHLSDGRAFYSVIDEKFP